MQFSRRLMVLSVVPAAMLVIASLVGVVALGRTEAHFVDVFEREQPLAQAVTEMYGHGLQMGQALRNILLDPSNPTAYRNLDDAAKAFDAASSVAMPLASGTAAQAPLRRVADARIRQTAARDKVLALAKTDTAGAITLLNKEETPAWREMRAGLMEAGKLTGARLQETRDGALADTHRAVRIALTATLIGAALAVLFPILVRHTLLRMLGGEPEIARDLVQAVASGDLTRQVPLRPGDTASLLSHLAAMRSSLAETMQALAGAVAHVNGASHEIASGNTDLSSRTEQQASALEQTAASMEQIHAQLKQSADSAQQASQLAAEASAVAVRGGEVMGNVVATMEAINASSAKITEIIGVIDGIAFQTNILALNAAVEAARAGAQGRGFAVVAAEVRTLAQRSAMAAREIKSLIDQSVTQINDGNRLVRSAGDTMQEIVAQVHRVTTLINEITSGAQEESSGIAQINQAVSQLDHMTQQNAALVEQSAAAALGLEGQAGQLQAMVARFKVHGALAT